MSDERKGKDWTRTGTVAGYAKYLRKQSGAICVLVIRPHDSVFEVDADCAPSDAERLVTEYLPRLTERVEIDRREKKQAARLEFGANRE
jgi:cysteine synthase